MYSCPCCSMDKVYYTHMRPLEYSWNKYIFHNIIVLCVNIYTCMCRLTTATMSLGMLGLLTLGISPWQGSSLTRCWVIHGPNFRQLQWSFKISITYFLGSLGNQLSFFPSLEWLPWKRSTLTAPGQFMSPALGTSSGLSSSYTIYFSLCVGLMFTHWVT